MSDEKGGTNLSREVELAVERLYVLQGVASNELLV